MENKEIITNAGIELENVVDSFIDEHLGVVIKKLLERGYALNNIIIKDMDNQVYTDTVTTVVTTKGIEIILPFSTRGEHEWREDIAKAMYEEV